MQILHISTYLFIPIHDPENLQKSFQAICNSLNLKGTILISHEGINLALAGFTENIANLKKFLLDDKRFCHLNFRESYSEKPPYKRLKVKLKKEIITLRQSNVTPAVHQAPNISPETLKEWLDEKRDITLLDTRNHYEIQFGAFDNAVNLHIEHFTEFPDKLDVIPNEKPIVMYCTGGIRCEKAAIFLLQKGYQEVYQLAGGILNYFERVGDAHYHGDCYVFDDRIAVTPTLTTSELTQCKKCNCVVTKAQQTLPSYIPDISCALCIG